jgi:hypothetical protein
VEIDIRITSDELALLRELVGFKKVSKSQSLKHLFAEIRTKGVKTPETNTLPSQNRGITQQLNRKQNQQHDHSDVDDITVTPVSKFKVHTESKIERWVRLQAGNFNFKNVRTTREALMGINIYFGISPTKMI